MTDDKSQLFFVEGNKIIIPFDTASGVPSKSGKTLILATSSGFKWHKLEDGSMIGISFNIIRSPRKP